MESVREIRAEGEFSIKPLSYKNYFNEYMKLKEDINYFLRSGDDYLKEKYFSSKKREHDYIKSIFTIKLQKSINRIRARNINNTEAFRIPNNMEFEINQATIRLENLKENIECVEISEEIWNYSKKILRNIYNQYLFRYNLKIPTPKIIFVEDSIEIEWESDSFKLILRISDFIQDISIYSRDKKGPPINGNVRKERIIDWVIFWLEQFLNS